MQHCLGVLSRVMGISSRDIKSVSWLQSFDLHVDRGVMMNVVPRELALRSADEPFPVQIRVE